MRIPVQFKDTTEKLPVDFKEFSVVSDGGFEKGYEQGHKDGYDVGYKEGFDIGSLSGRKVVKGTVTFATTQGTQNIVHNCGFIPTYFSFWIKEGTLPEEGTNTDYGCVLSGSFSQANGLKWSTFDGWVKFYVSPFNYRRNLFDQISNNDSVMGVTKTTMRLPRPGHTNYRYYAGYEYEWIAIE